MAIEKSMAECDCLSLVVQDLLGLGRVMLYNLPLATVK